MAKISMTLEELMALLRDVGKLPAKMTPEGALELTLERAGSGQGGVRVTVAGLELSGPVMIQVAGMELEVKKLELSREQVKLEMTVR